MKPNNSTKMDQKNIGVYLDLCNYNIIYIFIEVIMKYKTILLPTLFFAMSSFTTVNAESRYDSNGSYTVIQVMEQLISIIVMGLHLIQLILGDNLTLIIVMDLHLTQ
jgi:uncharacterized membrane protein